MYKIIKKREIKTHSCPYVKLETSCYESICEYKNQPKINHQSIKMASGHGVCCITKYESD